MQHHYTKTYDKENLENNTFNLNKLLFEWIWVTSHLQIIALAIINPNTQGFFHLLFIMFVIINSF